MNVALCKQQGRHELLVILQVWEHESTGEAHVLNISLHAYELYYIHAPIMLKHSLTTSPVFLVFLWWNGSDNDSLGD